MLRRNHLIWGSLIAIVALGAFFRFHRIATAPPALYPDEAMNGVNALQAMATGDFRAFYPDNNGREGLFINIQALSVWLLGTTSWALRAVSAIVGILTILGIYLVARELFESRHVRSPRGAIAALASAFFLAVNYWHLNFSRIGFRAITTPLFATFAIYFLLRGLRKGTVFDFFLAGVAAALGLNGYIAFRFMPFVLAVPLGMALWRWWRRKSPIEVGERYCLPCAIILFAFAAFVTIIPLGLYFIEHPDEFSSRTGQISVFADEYPLQAFAVSSARTAGMLFLAGDCNPRHNFSCLPALHPLVAIAFIVGAVGLWRAARREDISRTALATIAAWLLVMALPAALTREGMPHALRAIGMIPPVLLIAGFGVWPLWQFLTKRLNNGRNAAVVLMLLFTTIPITTYQTYFLQWARAEETKAAFNDDLTRLARFIAAVPPDIKKYLIVDNFGPGMPVSATSVVFLTNTATAATQREKNVTYLSRVNPEKEIRIAKGERVLVAFVAFTDQELLKRTLKTFPQLKKYEQHDFVILQTSP